MHITVWVEGISVCKTLPPAKIGTVGRSPENAHALLGNRLFSYKYPPRWLLSITAINRLPFWSTGTISPTTSAAASTTGYNHSSIIFTVYIFLISIYTLLSLCKHHSPYDLQTHDSTSYHHHHCDWSNNQYEDTTNYNLSRFKTYHT